ncbi:hydroxyethylthiazole kinase [Rhodoplanes roseus]|uniref:Hydroxyethylthiazole kinase n=1 Tax=Rhodoplanes roseus TaxID=29409 RepID=A0A327L1H1_9BRAD|nr:hydroxyethylthiazole kinase [Rhodoplanes roseus]RAI43693.1 hydroxyethylthiazole kinase [Rhodoplanes roseus]
MPFSSETASTGERAGAGDAAAAHTLVETAADVLERLRARRPRVHCITNTVAQTYTANLLLAAGAVPSMTIAADEVAAFVTGADALVINIGTLDETRRAAIGIAIDAACEHEVPWVLDPVFVDRSPARASFGQALLAMRPAAMRLNQAEFATLSGAAPEPAAIARFARDSQAVIALTGETDLVAGPERLVAVANGHRWMARITAMGCAGAALVAACRAVEPDAWRATVAALVCLGVAGERAAVVSAGPGTLATAILDALFDLDREDLHERARVS